MRRGFVTAAVAVAVAGLLASAPAVLAQTTDKPGGPTAPTKGGHTSPSVPNPGAKDTPAASPAMSEGKQIEGTVTKVMGNKVTLSDGTQLTVPADAKFSRADLKTGASIKASYEERNGEKVMTGLEVAPSGMKKSDKR